MSLRLSGLPGFTLVWIGQLISVLATQMSAFALSVWVYERTGSTTALGLTQAFALGPLVVLSPNLLFSMTGTLAQPFVLARTANDELTLGG